jgi:hypothetical protein
LCFALFCLPPQAGDQPFGISRQDNVSLVLLAIRSALAKALALAPSSPITDNPEPSNPFLVQDFPKIRFGPKVGVAVGCRVRFAGVKAAIACTCGCAGTGAKTEK